jgi:hypothetical protein
MNTNNFNAFASPIKDKTGNFFARAVDHGSEALLLAKKKMSDMMSDDSQAALPPETPRVTNNSTLRDFFQDQNLPSPPRMKEDMTMKAVHEALDVIKPDWRALRDSSDPKDNEKYHKSVWAVGKGMFDKLLKRPPRSASASVINKHQLDIERAKIFANMIVDKNEDAGKRFHTMFSEYDAEDRTWTMNENFNQAMRIQDYEYYLKHRLFQILKA